MEMDNKEMNNNYLRAKKRVEKIKGFYTHFAAYLVVNIVISILKIVDDVEEGSTIGEAFSNGDNFELWLWWGIGVAFHAYGVFGQRLLFMNKDWEEKKIKEYMDEE